MRLTSNYFGDHESDSHYLPVNLFADSRSFIHFSGLLLFAQNVISEMHYHYGLV